MRLIIIFLVIGSMSGSLIAMDSNHPEVEAARIKYQRARDSILASTFLPGCDRDDTDEAFKERSFNNSYEVYQDIEKINESRIKTAQRRIVASTLTCAPLTTFFALCCLGASSILHKMETSDMCVPIPMDVSLPCATEATCCCLAAVSASVFCLEGLGECYDACKGRRRARYYQWQYEKIMALRPISGPLSSGHVE